MLEVDLIKEIKTFKKVKEGDYIKLKFQFLYYKIEYKIIKVVEVRSEFVIYGNELNSGGKWWMLYRSRDKSRKGIRSDFRTTACPIIRMWLLNKKEAFIEVL